MGEAGSSGTSEGGKQERSTGGFGAAVREFLFGLSGYEFARQAMETRSALETLFMVTVVGEMLGLPVLPPYYALRLLPFVVPNVSTWKRRVLRQREFTDEEEYHLHGV